MGNFEDIKALLERMIDKADLPIPEIIPAHECDPPCDVTRLRQIRINVDHGESELHATHIFGHWLCDAHHGYWLEHDDDRCEQIAEFIAELVRKNREYELQIELQRLHAYRCACSTTHKDGRSTTMKCHRCREIDRLTEMLRPQPKIVSGETEWGTTHV